MDLFTYIYIHIENIYIYIYIHIYIYGTPPKPMQTSILLVFTVNFIYCGTDVVPIKFEAPTVGKLKNWKTEFHRRSLGSILLLWNSVFQFFSSRLLLKGENPKSWKNWKNQVTPSCVNNLEYEHLTPRSIEATDYTRIGKLRQGKNKQIIDLWALSDNLRVGAALNAVRTAEYIINQGYLKI